MEPADLPKPQLVESKNTKKRGRPRVNSQTEPVETIQASVPATPFDPPPADLQPDHSKVPPKPKRALSPYEFFRYWTSIPKIERDEWFKVYVYRGLPKCDVTQTLSDEQLRAIASQKVRKPETNCGKLTEPIDPEHWKRFMLDTYGAGDYGLRLNDQHPSIKNSICFTTIDAETGGPEFRDFDAYPPVLNPAEVVLTEEINKPYIRWARLKGIKFPGDPDTEAPAATQEGEEMATVLDTVMRSNKELTDKVVEMSERAPRGPVVNASDPAARAQLGGIETVVDAAKQSNKILADAMSSVIDRQAKGSDPSERLKETVEIIKLVMPAKQDNSELLAIFKMQMDSQDKNATRQLEQQEKNFTRILESERENHKTMLGILTGRIDSLEKAKSDAPTTSEEKGLDSYLRIRKKIREVEDEEGGEEDSGPAWMQFGSKVLDSLTKGMETLATMRAPALQTPAPQAAAELPAAAAAPKPQPAQDSEMVEYAKKIHKPLVDAIRAGRLGYDFAAVLIMEAGELPYNFLSGSGYDGITKFLQCYPPLWQELLSPPIGGVALEKFIAEFLDREKVAESVRMLKEKPASPLAAPGPRRVTVNPPAGVN